MKDSEWALVIGVGIVAVAAVAIAAGYSKAQAQPSAATTPPSSIKPAKQPKLPRTLPLPPPTFVSLHPLPPHSGKIICNCINGKLSGPQCAAPPGTPCSQLYNWLNTQQNCICTRDGTYSGLGCPLIGQACGDLRFPNYNASSSMTGGVS